MIGQGLRAYCPHCGLETNCTMRERTGQEGFKEIYLECHLCKLDIPYDGLEQENTWYRKEQLMAKDNGVFLVVKGEPVPQGRPRFASVKGRFIHAYDPDKSVNYKNLVKWHIRLFMNKYPEFKLLDKNIVMELEVFRHIPESFSKKKKEEAELRLLLPNTKPDTDNYVKTVQDAANGLIYKDDSSIVKIIASKFYSAVPRIEVSFYTTKSCIKRCEVNRGN